MRASLISALKTLRRSQPFNRFATTSARAASRMLGIQSEFLIKHLHRVGQVSSPLPNGRSLRLWSLGDDWVSNQVYWRGWRGYEPETTPLFLGLASSARVTLDVGAYVGFYSILAGHANPQGVVYAFEPHPGIFPRLKGNIALNELPNAECIRVAAGDRDGVAELYHVTSGMPTSSSLSLGFMDHYPDLRHSTVEVVNIDRFLADREVGHVDLVKVDTETTEPLVLRGMQRTLERSRPSIVCEVLHGFDTGPSLEALLAPMRYHYYLLKDTGPDPREHIAPHEIWRNYLLTPAPPEQVSQLYAKSKQWGTKAGAGLLV